jgi:microsomal prostaglandin-E synthase 1
MTIDLNNPAFFAYIVTALILCLNLMALWGYSGVARGKSGVAINAEDGALFKVPLSETDPPAVARVLRAHRNAEAVIYPFLILGLIFVLSGGAAWLAKVLFGVFTVARLLHSVVYLNAMQPWRTGLFIVSGACLIALMVSIVVLLLR